MRLRWIQFGTDKKWKKCQNYVFDEKEYKPKYAHDNAYLKKLLAVQADLNRKPHNKAYFSGLKNLLFGSTL